MRKTIASFTVPYVQVLNEKGKFDKKLDPKINAVTLKKMYGAMVLARTVDETILKLQREGRAGVYAPLRGQEASQVGTAFALAKEDWLFPMYRDVASMIVKGMPLVQIFQYFRGDERGFNIPENINMFPFAIPVSTQNPHAVGVAMASVIKKEKKAFMCHLGDGASSKGDFYEAMNFAGVFKSPVVFVCENNQYAISVRRENQTAAKTIAQKAIACGFEGIQVDGNDLFAVYKVAQEAVKKAKQGKGPTLIECFTYRLADHTTADDASKYRTDKEVKQWEKKDPLLRTEKYIISKKIMNADSIKKIKADALRTVDSAVKKAETIAPQDPKEIFSHMYAEMPRKLKNQMDYMISFGGKKK